MYYKAHGMLRKTRKQKSGGYKNILDRWHNDDTYRKSLSDIEWTEEQIIQHDAIALEDHSYVATWQARSRNEKLWKLSLNAEGFQGPISAVTSQKRSKNAKKLYDEHTAITEDGK